MSTPQLWSNTVNYEINPRDDFFNHVNINWIKNNPIPDDMSRWGMFNILDENNKKKIRKILRSDSINENIINCEPSKTNNKKKLKIIKYDAA